MKTVEKFSMDELEQMMHCIGKNELGKYTGGTGNGSWGSYTEEEFWSMLENGTWEGGYVQGIGYAAPEVEITGSSRGSDYCSIAMNRIGFSFEQKLDIIEMLCDELGYDPDDFNLGSFMGSYGDANGHAYDGTIGINLYGPLWRYGNLYDMALVMVHEKHHVDTQEDANTNMSEVEAYQAMKDHPFYQYASDAFKNEIEAGFNYYYQKYVKEGEY
jgi:hypothetical protein